jgi:hypothetical protein
VVAAWIAAREAGGRSGTRWSAKIEQTEDGRLRMIFVPGLMIRA